MDSSRCMKKAKQKLRFVLIIIAIVVIVSIVIVTNSNSQNGHVFVHGRHGYHCHDPGPRLCTPSFPPLSTTFVIVCWQINIRNTNQLHTSLPPRHVARSFIIGACNVWRQCSMPWTGRFLAVQNSSIGLIVRPLLAWSDPTNNQSLHNITEWP